MNTCLHQPSHLPVPRSALYGVQCPSSSHSSSGSSGSFGCSDGIGRRIITSGYSAFESHECHDLHIECKKEKGKRSDIVNLSQNPSSTNNIHRYRPPPRPRVLPPNILDINYAKLISPGLLSRHHLRRSARQVTSWARFVWTAPYHEVSLVFLQSADFNETKRVSFSMDC
jgi:hypothetical protein